MRTFLKTITILLLGLGIFACASQAENQATKSVLGTWNYKLIDSNFNVYDKGTITFSGEDGGGTWKQKNLYEIEYQGNWSLEGSTFTLKGSEIWKGSVVDAKHLKGTWTNDDGENGSFELTRP